MIRGIHGLLYSADAEATRAFIRDKLKLPYTDTGGGWLIFDLPEGDMGVHPIDESGDPKPGTHDISFYCDDIRGTVAELRGRGVPFKGEIADHGYGLVTYFTMPGGVEVQLYEPKYTKRASRTKVPTKRVARARRKRPARPSKRQR
jgi:catechol 2,3-dioxygenase-like lactoylglutathione lyase family enzyme